jgi:hypothetical protein
MLIWKMPTIPEAPHPVKPGFNWDHWYAKNKQRLSEKRAKRYQEDPIYRAAALERSRQQRELKKVVPPITDGYTVAFTDAATTLGVTVWVLREWRRKSYFPEPHRRDGRLWFSDAQVQTLQALRSFFDTHGIRMTENLKPALEDVVRLIYANW